MGDELVPQPPEWRLSDADRNRVGEQLRAALGEGRLTLEEFEHRLIGVLAARTWGEISPYFSDLPGTLMSVPAPESAELRTMAADLKRRGAWVVPKRLLAAAKAGSVKLDFTEAFIAHHITEIELDVYAGSTTLILPSGASADIDRVKLIASPLRVHGVPSLPGAGRHFVVHGKQCAGRLVVRYQRRFLRWRW